eukprot:CAMPEP_0174927876 /NCGR_PEP_ID=MMETSP1355-20121228/21823_1 /TAXON_ID=464990 /ORGANISM="Hemiselmis tepida, Strain CCMP443" /LENGTH=287 /DNA_ID=CAMNT_0016174009 /DNA_START=40 /DNA_END=903 /DNA_ORIENTATION=-
MTRLLLLLGCLSIASGAMMPAMGGMPGLRLRGGADAAGDGAGAGGLPNMPPGFNADAMSGMFQNPAFQNMAKSLMDNPEFKKKMDDMMKNETLMQEYAKIGQQAMGMFGAGGGAGGEGGKTLGDLEAGGAGGAGGGAGGMPGLPGMDGAGFEQMQSVAQNMMKDYLKPEKMEELAKSDDMKDLQNDPKMQEIVKDVQTNGPMSVLKYYSDPDAMKIFTKISKLIGLPDDFSKAGADFAKMVPPGAMAGMPGLGGVPGAGAGAADAFGADMPKAGGPNFTGGAATDLE